MSVVVKITPNDKGNPPGKLADAELHFIGGELDGLKLLGFSIWERRGGGGRNVTFPARTYSVNGDRRSYALLRPIARSLGLLQGRAKAPSECSTSSRRRLSANFAMRRCMPSWRSLWRRAQVDTRCTWPST